VALEFCFKPVEYVPAEHMIHTEEAVDPVAVE
jgi:hypothetical protein